MYLLPTLISYICLNIIGRVVRLPKIPLKRLWSWTRADAHRFMHTAFCDHRFSARSKNGGVTEGMEHHRLGAERRDSTQLAETSHHGGITFLHWFTTVRHRNCVATPGSSTLRVARMIRWLFLWRQLRQLVIHTAYGPPGDLCVLKSIWHRLARVFRSIRVFHGFTARWNLSRHCFP